MNLAMTRRPLTRAMMLMVMILCAAVAGSVAGHAPSGYIFTLPLRMWERNEEKICLAEMEEGNATSLKFTLESLKNNDNRVIVYDLQIGEDKCAHFTVPEQGRYNAILEMIDDEDSNVTYHLGNIDVAVRGQNMITLIQSDKPMYKPGQTVKFRMMTFDYKLKPRIGMISLVAIHTPSDVRVRQWRNVNASHGLVSLEMPLVADATLGIWKIKATVDGHTTTQTFEVKEYVLPKFEVTVTPPKYILPTTEVIEAEVCARYTYGQPVKGTVSFEIWFSQYSNYWDSLHVDGQSSQCEYQRGCYRQLDEIKGCYKISANTSDLGFGGARFRLGQLRIVANVTEEGTGTSLSGQSTGPKLSKTALTLKFESAEKKFFKPGFPYREKLFATKPDGSAAPGETIEIIVKNRQQKFYLHNNFTTDENGTVSFTVINIPENVTMIRIDARAIMQNPYSSSYHYRYQPTAYSRARRWYSPSNSFMQIVPQKSSAECGSDVDFTVYYTTPDISNYKFHYMVMSNNHVVLNGQKQNHFQEHDAHPTDIDPDELLTEFIIPPPPRPTYRPPPHHRAKIESILRIWNNYNVTTTPEPEPSIASDIGIPHMLLPPLIKDMQRVTPTAATFSWYSILDYSGSYRIYYRSLNVEGDYPWMIKEVPSTEISAIIKSLHPDERYHLKMQAIDGKGRGGEVSKLYTIGLQRRSEGHVAKLTIQVPVSVIMAPESQLLVYYIRDDKETVADQTKFKVNKCFNNKVDLEFSEETVLPGKDATMTLKAEPGSYCSVGVMDKSITLLSGNNQFTPDKIFDLIPKSYNHYHKWRLDQMYCSKKYGHRQDNGIRYRSSYRYNTNTVDALKAFRDMGLATFTDLKVETRSCSYYTVKRRVYYTMRRVRPFPVVVNTPGDKAVMFTSESDTVHDDNQKAGPKPKAEIRSYFPETWLWDIEIVGETGQKDITKKIPHTLTEWVGNSVCANTEVGIGVSELARVTAFQPFFLSFTLPYSAVRNEVVPVLLTVSNYLTECLVMDIMLSPSLDFELRSGNGGTRRCVCGGDKAVLKYYIVPKELGEIKIQASAESIPDSDGTCGNQVVSEDGTGAADAVRRTLLIEAEGIEKEYTYSSYQCVKGEDKTIEIDLPLPPTELVPDSTRGKINIIGDVMGPVLSNLQNLLRMPYGCGEQNMASWSPNIVALQYLSNTNQLTTEIEEKAKNFMRIGYQRQLNYRHPDYSYSAWGGSGSGSMWLTAFVVKCLRQSSPYIEVDQDDVSNSIRWFLSKQQENGCFPKVGYTHSYYLKGGIAEGSNEASLTAFVLISMLESGQMNSFSDSVVNAIKCLDGHYANDTYTLALMAYAYTLYDVNYPRRQEIMGILESVAIYKDGGQQKYWARDKDEELGSPYSYWYRAPSAEVEITAYVLLSLIYNGEVSDVASVRPIIVWLTKQRNAYGGFSSTQDTVVGLQALSVYATIVYQHGLLLNITINGTQNSEMSFDVNDYNAIVLQFRPIENIPDTLYATFTGVGCAMIQANVKYNVFEVPESPAFDATVNVYRSKKLTNHCSRRTIQICASFTGPGDVSNMAIVDVKMVTGWIPVKSTLQYLVDNDDVDVKKFEVDKNKVSIYFDKFDSRGQCFYFDVEQDIELSNPEKASIRIYDYYETDQERVLQYSIKTTCGTKEELPYVEPDIFICGLRPMPTNEIVQVRLPSRIDTGPRTCAVCKAKSMKRKGQAFRKLVCDAEKIYKLMAGRKKKFALKLYVDIRTKMTKVNKYSNFEVMESCNCTLEAGKEERFLVFTHGEAFNAENETFTLDDRSTIVPWTKKLEGSVRKMVRRRRNGCT